jgi:hypothetical protein
MVVVVVAVVVVSNSSSILHKLSAFTDHHSWTVTWLRRLVTGLSLRIPVFAPLWFSVGFVVDKVALEQGFLRVLRFSPQYHFTVALILI